MSLHQLLHLFYDRFPHAYSKTRSLKVQPSNFQNKCLHEVICVSRQACSVCACVRVWLCAEERVWEGAHQWRSAGCHALRGVSGEREETPVQAIQVPLPSLLRLTLTAFYRAANSHRLCVFVRVCHCGFFCGSGFSLHQHHTRQSRRRAGYTTTKPLCSPRSAYVSNEVLLSYGYNWSETVQALARQKPTTLISIISSNS